MTDVLDLFRQSGALHELMSSAGRFGLSEHLPVAQLRNVACRGRPQDPVMCLVGLVQRPLRRRGGQLDVGSRHVHLIGDEHRPAVVRLPVGEFALTAGSDAQQHHSQH